MRTRATCTPSRVWATASRGGDVTLRTLGEHLHTLARLWAQSRTAHAPRSTRFATASCASWSSTPWRGFRSTARSSRPRGVRPGDVRTVADLAALPLTTKPERRKRSPRDLVALGVDPRLSRQPLHRGIDRGAGAGAPHRLRGPSPQPVPLARPRRARHTRSRSHRLRRLAGRADRPQGGSRSGASRGRGDRHLPRHHGRLSAIARRDRPRPGAAATRRDRGLRLEPGGDDRALAAPRRSEASAAPRRLRRRCDDALDARSPARRLRRAGVRDLRLPRDQPGGVGVQGDRRSPPLRRPRDRRGAARRTAGRARRERRRRGDEPPRLRLAVPALRAGRSRGRRRPDLPLRRARSPPSAASRAAPWTRWCSPTVASCTTGS